MIDSVTKVRVRITEIENRFNPKQPEQVDFTDFLKKAESKGVNNSPIIKRRTASINHGKGSIKQMLVDAARKHGVDESLVLAVANAESGYRSDAVSSVGAVGVMQLMPGTAASLGVTDSFDAKQNIDGGVRYLKQMLSRFGGNISLALAAYNAGPGAVEKYDGIPPYNETQAYVKNILADINE